MSYKVALTVQDNGPSFYGVFDTFNKSAGFNGVLLSRHSTETDAEVVCVLLRLADRAADLLARMEV